MASGKTSKRARNARSSVVTQRSIPWSTIAGMLVVLLFAGAVLGYVFNEQQQKKGQEDALTPFTPSQANQDPSKAIPGIVVTPYGPDGRKHVDGTQQVAYTRSPPLGGAHDFTWAACTGTIYPNPVRNENMVHSLEHGAVWIAYDPARITGEGLVALQKRVERQPYTMMSPYPALDQPISLQSWGHQLKLADPGDVRIDQFVKALRRNTFQHPEAGASCLALGPGQFDQDNPPPFQAAPPVSQVDGVRIVSELETNAQPGSAGRQGAVPNNRTGGGS